ncbi:Cupin domain-containing protein [Bacillus sp. ok061]|uniref:cupin domain-containing protein n=1 Tax=Bacillus sp. ok061 TaxID=1761766 RepID=UPI00089EBF0D|nr:cupin domain-containing protein [Bacillus sp. ok061]SEG81680.1 Cupin domain-containing protein [Bacillus sp. ok061]
MNQFTNSTLKGENYSAIQVGEWNDLLQYKNTNPFDVPGKVFLKDILQCTGMEVSLNVFPSGVSMPFYHKHKENEELYIFVKGKGQFKIDDEILEIKEGTVIRVAQKGERIWRNNSKEPLYFICIQAKTNTMEGSNVDDGITLDKSIKW